MSWKSDEKESGTTHEIGGGVNFAIFSRCASHVRLDFLIILNDVAPARTINLDAALNRTGDVWHVWIKGIVSGRYYSYRVDGPYAPNQEHRFNFWSSPIRVGDVPLAKLRYLCRPFLLSFATEK